MSNHLGEEDGDPVTIRGSSISNSTEEEEGLNGPTVPGTPLNPEQIRILERERERDIRDTELAQYATDSAREARELVLIAQARQASADAVASREGLRTTVMSDAFFPIKSMTERSQYELWEAGQQKVDNQMLPGSRQPRDRASITIADSIFSEVLVMIRGAGHLKIDITGRVLSFNDITRDMFNAWIDSNTATFRALMREEFNGMNPLNVVDTLKNVFTRILPELDMESGAPIKRLVGEMQKIEGSFGRIDKDDFYLFFNWMKSHLWKDTVMVNLTRQWITGLRLSYFT